MSSCVKYYVKIYFGKINCFKHFVVFDGAIIVVFKNSKSLFKIKEEI